jgi:hypothetical protein
VGTGFGETRASEGLRRFRGFHQRAEGLALESVPAPPAALAGKTYLGVQFVRALLANVRLRVNIGPLLVVCLTNHALDSFLESLLDAGMGQIVRVGGRGKSERLEPFNLQVQGRKVRTGSRVRHLRRFRLLCDRLLLTPFFMGRADSSPPSPLPCSPAFAAPGVSAVKAGGPVVYQLRRSLDDLQEEVQGLSARLKGAASRRVAPSHSQCIAPSLHGTPLSSFLLP